MKSNHATSNLWPRGRTHTRTHTYTHTHIHLRTNVIRPAAGTPGLKISGIQVACRISYKMMAI